MMSLVQTMLYPVTAVVCLLLSETFGYRNVTLFVITHSIWHILAFHCAYLVVS